MIESDEVGKLTISRDDGDRDCGGDDDVALVIDDDGGGRGGGDGDPGACLPGIAVSRCHNRMDDLAS